MPNYIIFTLFGLSYLMPALAAVIVWARRPQTIEGLTLGMTFSILPMVMGHAAFAIWLLPQQPIEGMGWMGVVLAWVVTAAATIALVGYFCEDIRNRNAKSSESPASLAIIHKTGT